MTDVRPDPNPRLMSDPFMLRLRRLRESLPAACEARYRFEEIEHRLLLMQADTEAAEPRRLP